MDALTISIIVGALLAVSEALSLIPAVQSNGIVQVLWRILKAVAGERRERNE